MGGPDPDTQGGGYRGGPRRWTGKGPRPARHIPWPEVCNSEHSYWRRTNNVVIALQAP